MEIVRVRKVVVGRRCSESAYYKRIRDGFDQRRNPIKGMKERLTRIDLESIEADDEAKDGWLRNGL